MIRNSPTEYKNTKYKTIPYIYIFLEWRSRLSDKSEIFSTKKL